MSLSPPRLSNSVDRPVPAALRLRPELLAPAGDFECARAAVENGADAVYFGLDSGFNARARATNISDEQLPELMRFLHQRGVKGFLALNTLVFTNELPEIERLVRRVAEVGVDAVLVQDIGAVRLIRATCPDLPIHASTQMTLTSAEGIRIAAELGVERVVLARELAISDIAKIAEQTDMPLEAFVHGALCVAYSGQCLTSESLGGRSANRGQCAQACRMPYELVCDGEEVDLGDQKYLLSPQDLAAYALAPDLIDAGVISFKIEGRLKTPEYVANITRHYRQAIDTALAGQPVEFSLKQVEEMQLSFSRGFSTGWLQGDDHKMLVPARSSAKRGVLLGTVKGIHGQRVAVELACSIARGDGLAFEGDRAANDEQGGRVFEVFRRGESVDQPVSSGVVELAFQHGAIDYSRVWIGQEVWKTDDPQLTSRLRKTFTGPDPLRKVPLDVNVFAAVGQALCIAVRTETGLVAEVYSPEPLAAAIKHPLTESVLREQLSRLGGTVYELHSLHARISGAPMIPLSVLSKLRHELIRQLDEAVSKPPTRRIASTSVLADLRAAIRKANAPARPTNCPAPSTTCPAPSPRRGEGSSEAKRLTTLHVICRTLPQLQALLDAGERNMFADFQDIREYREAVLIARGAGAELWLATPRIQRPGEVGLFRAIAKHEPDGILVRNLGGLWFFGEPRAEGAGNGDLQTQTAPLPNPLPGGERRPAREFIADFSLNVTNELTAQFLIERGARRVTASYDLNREQLLDLVAACPPVLLEIVIHQHMPMFHMEHCVFCAVLSPGTNATNCGRPCDRHVVHLRDRIGMEHCLTADVGCRNTLFNAVPQSAADVVPELMARGVRHFRIELLDETPAEIRLILSSYRSLLRGETTGRDVWQKLNAANRVGVTRGTLEERRHPLAIL